MTFRDLLELCKISPRPTSSVPCGCWSPAMVVLRIDPGDGDDAPILNTGISWVEQQFAYE